jgi:DNA modification methylase
MSVRILLGDVREKLAELPDESVHCVVTSPPYFGLRDYGTASWEGGDPACDHSTPRSRGDDIKSGDKQGTSAGSRPNTQRECKCGATRIDRQIGLEPTPAEFVAVMVEVFRDVRRVLRKDGTLWLNLGDSYASAWACKRRNVVGNGSPDEDTPRGRTGPGLKEKDLIGIPWRVAFALQADGWYLRQDIIWSKPNPMPESVTDRCTKAHEYLFLLSKSARYFYDNEAIREPSDRPDLADATRNYVPPSRRLPGDTREEGRQAAPYCHPDGRNRRSVWTVATQPFKEAHFATFPPDLIEPCIKAGCPKDCCAKCGAPVVRETERVDQGFDGSRYGERAVAASGGAITGGTAKSTLGSSNGKLVGKTETTGWLPSCTCDAGLARGTVLDPFGGAGTTGLVADRLQRDAILIELNPEYAGIAERRIQGDAPMFAQVNA